ncbi:hypothetical protein F4803DRAFT_507214 [Xylaria telfairii]|nr:hypothetical protein F4803DRAFT_507214 [Xylaria telfairii]
MGDPRKLRWVLWMIVGSFILLQLPTAVLFVFISFRYNERNRVTDAFDSIDIAQLAGVALQESILSGLYVYTSRTTLKPMEIIKGPKVRKLLRELIGLFVLVVALDISIVIIQVTNHFDIQTTYKPVVYSIKLKVETFVLNNLVTLLVHPGCSCQQTGFQNDGRALNMTTSNDLTYGSWRSRYTSSAGVTDSAERYGISGCAGGGSASTACIDESGRIKVPAKLSSL